MSQPRRRFGRFDRELPVELVIEGTAAEGRTLNLGLGGMAVRCDLTPEFDAEVEFRLRLPRPDMTVQARGRVLWSRQTGGQVGIVGVSFEALRPIDVWGLLQYFASSAGEGDEAAVLDDEDVVSVDDA